MTVNDACKLITAAMMFLPASYNTPGARAMLMAIGMQESRFQHRQQISGPARGYWQFEEIGVRGVLTHRATSFQARDLVARLDYAVSAPAVYGALAHNDILAAGFARLLLFSVPASLPGPDDEAEGWRQYLSAWRPGKPHRETWAGYYQRAWHHVGGGV